MSVASYAKSLARDFDADRFLKSAGLLVVFCLAAAIFYFGYFGRASYFLPTWDNSMLHAGRAVYMIETGHFSENEVVFGGVTPTYHSPFYPALVAGFSVLSGLDFAWAERALSFLCGLLLPFAFYCLAKAISGDWRAGVAAALFSLWSSSLMTWATRNSPISIGNILVPLGLYFVLRRKTWLAALCAVALALDHQPSLLVFVASVFLFFAYEYLMALPRLKEIARKPVSLFSSLFGKGVITATIAGLSAFGAYMAWHIRQTGLSCLTFHCMPQTGAHEFGKPVSLVTYFSALPQALAALGVAALALDRRIPSRHKAVLFAYFLACVLLVKNDLYGIATFTERFVTYLDGAVAVLAGVGVASALSLLDGSVRTAKDECE